MYLTSKDKNILLTIYQEYKNRLINDTPEAIVALFYTEKTRDELFPSISINEFNNSLTSLDKQGIISATPGSDGWYLFSLTDAGIEVAEKMI